MYEDMYTDYSDYDVISDGKVWGETLFVDKDGGFPYNYPFSFNRANKDYLKPYPPVRDWWYYGENKDVILKRHIRNPEVLQDKYINVTFYNFRKEPIHNVRFEPNTIQLDGDSNLELHCEIDYNTSNLYFTRGIYFCGITLDDIVIDEYGNEEITASDVILNRDNYIIRVI